MRKFLIASLMAGVAIPATPAFAADEEEAGKPPITVTAARRRDEDVQDVPIAIKAIGGDELAKRAIYNENDLQSAVPGLVIRTSGGSNAFNYVIRGQSVDNFTNSPAAVLPYTNEVQIKSHSATPFYDMQGIQVLKGPQGTLFGRNATGGAVLYTTAQPTDVLEGYGSIRYTNHNQFHAEGTVNMPFDEGSGSAIRIAGSYTNGGAYVRDFFSKEKYGGIDQISVRGSLKLELSPILRNTIVVQYTDEDGTNTPYELWSVYPCGATNGTLPLNTDPGCIMTPTINPDFATFLANNPNAYQGGIIAATALQNQLGPWQSLSNIRPRHEARQTWVINTTEIDVADNLKIKNIFGYNKSNSDDDYDYDGSPYPYFEVTGTFGPNGKSTIDNGFLLETRQISNEFQLQGQAFDNRLDYVVGFYYLSERFRVRSHLDFRFFIGGSTAPFRFVYTAQTKTESIAGFAQGTFKLTDRLNLTGGFRITRDKTTIVQLEDSLFTDVFGFPNIPETQKASKPSWTVSLDYKVTPDLMVYIAHRGSWRSGSYNYSTPPINQVAALGGNKFLPETTVDAELGLKYSGDGLGVPTTFNVAVYQQWVKNIQRAVYINTPAGVSLLTANVPRAKITGFEADLTVRPSQYVSFGMSVNYTDARYTRNTTVVLSNTVAYGPFADVPKWSGTLFGEATLPLGPDTGDMVFRVDAYTQAKMPYSNVGATTSPDTTLPKYTLVNARLTWAEVAGSPVDMSIFARNLFNKKYYTGGNPGQSGGLPNTVTVGMPRFWGGEVRVRFQ